MHHSSRPSGGIPSVNVLLGHGRIRPWDWGLERCQAWAATSFQGISRFTFQQQPTIAQQRLGLIEPGQILRISPMGTLLMQLGIQAVQPLFQGH
jgi:hypothetical protein